MEISTNDESDNNEKKKTLKQRNLRWNTLKNKNKEINTNNLEIILGMKITVSFDTSILTPVSVVTKEPKTSVLLCSPAAKFMTELQKKL